MPFAIGENVGPYRILEQLGQGGMATVYKAYHPALDRSVAIKALHPAFMEDPTFLARFQREARVVARLEHPGIVPVYDFAEHNGQPYLVMKFIEGETLKARLARGGIGRTEALRIVEAVCAALAYAHSRGILHRDIKPSNILLAPDGTAFLADFGLARIAQAGESTLSSDVMMGTPHYISPEQARGERQLDEGTDLYSLGVVLYELEVGRVPFSADTPFSIVHDHIYTPLPLPRAINPAVPEAVERFLLKALAKERAGRFASAGQMLEAYSAAAGAAVLAPGPPTAERTTASRPSARPGAAPAGRDASRPSGSRPSAARPAARRGRRGWIWALGGLALTCVCIVAFLALADLAGDEQGAGQPPPAGQAIPDQAALEQARSEVQSNPGDPAARQRLGDVLSLRGDAPGAAEAWRTAGELWLRQERYAEAARALARALELTGGPGAASPDLIDGLFHALFLGAASTPTASVAGRLTEQYPDWEALRPVAARSLLYGGAPEQAVDIANRTLDSQPGHPIALSVLAEWHLMRRNPDLARAQAEQALSQPDLPGWLIPHLERLARADRPG